MLIAGLASMDKHNQEQVNIRLFLEQTLAGPEVQANAQLYRSQAQAHTHVLPLCMRHSLPQPTVDQFLAAAPPERFAQHFRAPHPP